MHPVVSSTGVEFYYVDDASLVSLGPTTTKEFFLNLQNSAGTPYAFAANTPPSSVYPTFIRVYAV
jgi:hypothetical protein